MWVVSASHLVVFPCGLRSLKYWSPLSSSGVSVTSCCILPCLIYIIFTGNYSDPRTLLEVGIQKWVYSISDVTVLL